MDGSPMTCMDDLFELADEMHMIDTSRMTDQTLLDFDDMMSIAVLTPSGNSALASAVWSDVLKELEITKKIRLTGGSLDDPPNALWDRV